jgi:M6 family metalloprotease-like protein
MKRPLWGAAVLVALAVSVTTLPADVSAQQRRFELTRTGDGVVLDYAADAAWRRKALAVARVRSSLWSSRQLGLLNAGVALAGPMQSPPALTGTLHLPTILMTFSDWNVPVLPEASEYDALLYGTSAPVGQPYSLRTYYEELSNGAFIIEGKAFGWVEPDSGRDYYANACGLDAPPTYCELGRQRTYEAFTRVLGQLDPGVDFGQYDSDGPDGVPNSGDDDGVVDVVQFVHPERGYECLGTSYGAHKFSLTGLGGAAFETDDAATGGGTITIDPYHIVAGFGGASCLEYAQIMPIGIAAHELGHAIGLPDLYDTDPNDEDDSPGIGEWGLMGSGSYTSPTSPSHLSAWSKERLGWVTVVELSTTQQQTVGPVVTGDTVFRIQPWGTNPRGEYFLLESKQPFGSDTANLGGGLYWDAKSSGMLVWHIDSLRIAEAEPFNRVNTGLIHGVNLVRDYPGNDPYYKPHRLSNTTEPRASLNVDSSFAGFSLDSIYHTAVPNEMMFQFAKGGLTVITPSHYGPKFRIDGGEELREFEDILFDGNVYTLSTDTLQSGIDVRLVFESWSDGGDRVHSFVASSAGDSIVAQFSPRYWVTVRIEGRGRVVARDTVGMHDAVGFHTGAEVTLEAIPDDRGTVFVGWTGSITSSDDTLRLYFDQRYELGATFQTTLAVVSDTLATGRVGIAYVDTLHATGGTGGYRWSYQPMPEITETFSVTPFGVLTGVPKRDGTYRIRAIVTSGFDAVWRDVYLPVTAPAVEETTVVDQILGLSSEVEPEVVDYLDFLGNQNGRLDVGDYMLWTTAQSADSPGQGVVAGSSKGKQP